ncbi:TetR family transcriptional regulator [Bacteroidia bacterium]|nr:TetR family transcriptional regulator [Bacteroidia bacterium]
MDLKDRIVRESSTLFFKKGIRSMTMSDIANELGVSKRTLYEVFRDKEELLENCINFHMAKADREVERLATTSENVIDTFMRIYAIHLQEVRDVNKSVIHDLRKYHPNIYRKIECRQQEDVSMFNPLFKKGIAEGLIREDVNYEILLYLLKAQFRVLMDDESIPVNKYSTGEFIQTIILNFVRGIATPLGMEKINAFLGKLKKTEEI